MNLRCKVTSVANDLVTGNFHRLKSHLHRAACSHDVNVPRHMQIRQPTHPLRHLAVRRSPLRLHQSITPFVYDACMIRPLISLVSGNLEHSTQVSGAQRSPMSASTSVQEPSASLWDDIVAAYDRARASGAAYKTDTNTELYRDPRHGIEFVLRVAAALRDKPKPPMERHELPSACLNALLMALSAPTSCLSLQRMVTRLCWCGSVLTVV